MGLKSKTLPAAVAETPLLQFKSKEAGRNADVTIFENRIERRKERSFGSLSRASQESETTPIRAISSVQVVKDGLKSRVIVHATGNPIEFRVPSAEAAKIRDVLTDLILGHSAHAPAAAAPSKLDELAKLHALHAAGAISDAEFAAHKDLLLAAV